MAGISVGSVSVDVVPSAKGFATQLRRDLVPQAAAIGDEIGRELSNRINAQIGDIRVNADTRPAMTEAEKLTREIDKQKPKVTVEADTKRATTEAAKLVAEIDRRKAKINVDVDTHGIRPHLAIVDRMIRHLGERSGAAGRASRGLTRLMGAAFGGLGHLALAGGKGAAQAFSTAFQAVPPRIKLAIVAGVLLAVPLIPAAAALIGAALVSGIAAGFITIGVLAVKSSKQVQATWKSTSTAIQADIKAAAAPLIPVIQHALQEAKKIFDQFKPVFKSAFTAISPALNSFLDQMAKGFHNLAPAVKPIMKAFGDILNQLGPLLPGIFSQIAKAVEGLASAISKHKQGITKLIEFVILTIPAAIKVLTWMIDTGAAVVNFFSGPFVHFFESIGKWFVDKWNWVKTQFGLLWDTIKATVRDAWTVIKATFLKGVRTVVDVFLGMVSAILHGAADAFGWVPGIGPKLQTAADQFDGFKRRVDTALGGIPDQKNITVTATGKWSNAALVAQGTRHISGGSFYAVGGAVSGPGTGTSDSIHAMLSHGEHVWTAAEVDAAGGHRVVANLRSRALAKQLPGFAAGGAVVHGSPGNIDPGGNAWLNAEITQWAKKLAATFMSITGDSGVRSASAAAAQAYAAEAIGRYGWGPGQMGALIRLWNRESGWNAYAVNHSSGAYGIPQSLGHGHPYNLGDYVTQVNWGLNYIASRYGSPAAAWGHEMAYGWYDQGGILQPGATMAFNGTGKNEFVFTQDQLDAMSGGGNTTNNNFAISEPSWSPDQIANEVMRRLNFAMRP